MNTYFELVRTNAKDCKYTRWYINICNAAQLRVIAETKIKAKKEAKTKFGYIEGHHVLPQCICDDDQKKDFDNYAYLTAREHFICHWLLCKMFSGEVNMKMRYAFRNMSRTSGNQQREYTARQFDIIKKNSKGLACMAGKSHSEETKAKMSAAALGEKNHRFGKDAPNKGVPCSEEQKKKIREAVKNNPKASSGHPKRVQVGEMIFDSGKDAAKHFNCSRAAICLWIKSGKARHV